MKKFVFVFLLLLAGACGDGGSDEEQAEDCALCFGQAFFNLDLHQAAELCTQDSQHWINFMATNLTQADLDLIDASGISVLVRKVTLTSDSTAEATVDVSHFMKWHGLEQPATIENDGEFRLDLVKRQGKWLVRMAGLPQNEMRNRD